MTDVVELKRKVEEDEELLRGMKLDLTQRQADGVEVNPDELEKIVKLEVRLENLRLFVEAQELTRG